MSKAPLPSEEAIHKAVAQFLDTVIKPPEFWSTIPSGGGGKIRGARLKAMGLKRGLPDLMIFRPGPQILAIELKAPKGSLTPDQKAVREILRACGLMWTTCKSVQEVNLALRVFRAGWPERRAA